MQRPRKRQRRNGTSVMGVAFEKPSFDYAYQVEAQVSALRSWRDKEPGRRIPAKAADRLLLATWNVANLGLQERASRTTSDRRDPRAGLT